MLFSDSMADAKQQLLSYVPPDDEQVCPSDCVLVSEDGTELPAHQSFLFMHSKELGKMLAVATPDDKGGRRLQVRCYTLPSAMHRTGLGTTRRAQLCMMLLLQTQDSAESLGLLLKELYDATEVKSIIDADTVLPLLLIADKYDAKTIVWCCTTWLNRLNRTKLRDTLLALSPERGEVASCKCMGHYRNMRATLINSWP